MLRSVRKIPPALRTIVQRRHNHFNSPHLAKCPANYASLTPLSTFERTVSLYPSSPCYVYGDMQRSWGEVDTRVRKFSSALQTALADMNPAGTYTPFSGDVVSVICPNTHPIFEAHFAVPGVGAVLHTINTRLDATTIAYQLRHSEAKIVLLDTEYTQVMRGVKDILTRQLADSSREERYELPMFINIEDPAVDCDGLELVGETDYESFIAGGDEKYELLACADEWEAISLNYTSGTTGNPKGVVFHYRGAYLNSIGNAVEWNMERFAKFLWVVPMFHCNGWLFPWTMASVAGCSFFMRQVRANIMFDLISKHEIGYLCGAPITMSTMLSHPERKRFQHHVQMWTAGAPPPPAVIRQFTDELGVNVQTAYGLTETYGPITTHLPDPEWVTHHKLNDEDLLLRSTFQSRDALVQDLKVLNPETLEEVPDDGATMGEVMMKGNTVMKGYLKNPKATEECFAGGWFRSGDLAVRHANGRFELKDRSKDIIISGGENISSIEVENIMMTHPSIAEVAVIAMPDEKWGEVPCAFVKYHESPAADQPPPTDQELIAWCRTKMAAFQAPKRVVFTEIPKTSTGKMQKNLLRNLL